MSDAKKIVSKVSSMDVEDLEQVKDTVAESYIIHEGFGRKVASRLAALIGAPVSFILTLAGISADAEGWSQNAWTVYAHDFMNNNFGDARGFVVLLFLVLTFVFLFWGLANWNKGKERA